MTMEGIPHTHDACDDLLATPASIGYSIRHIECEHGCLQTLFLDAGSEC